jgi:integrase
LQYTAASINIRLQNLKTFLRWAQEREYLERIPPIRLLPRERRLARGLSGSEVAAWLSMLQAIRRHRSGQGPLRLPNGSAFHPKRMQRRSAALRERFLRVAYDTGCHSSEIFHLELSQFDLEQGLLRVEFKQRFAIKERHETVIPLTRRRLHHLGSCCWARRTTASTDIAGRTTTFRPGTRVSKNMPRVTAALSRCAVFASSASYR